MDIIKYRRELKPLEKICVSKEAANKIIQKAHEEAEKVNKAASLLQNTMMNTALYSGEALKVNALIQNVIRKCIDMLESDTRNIDEADKMAINEFRREMFHKIATMYDIEGIYVK